MMNKYAWCFFILYSAHSFSQTLPTTVAYTPEDIVAEKINKINQKYEPGTTPEITISLFKSSETSQAQNLASVIKSQQIGIDLNSEGDDLRSKVLQSQIDNGDTNPMGCGDTSVLSTYNGNVCIAADALQVMAIESVELQSVFREIADKSYNTMEDTSAYILDNSSANKFNADAHGLPTEQNILYPENKKAIENFSNVFKELDSKSEYKGLKYNTKKDYFYLEGKKYSTEVLYSKDAMLKAGISKSLVNFVYTMLGKKSTSAQSKIVDLLKKKNMLNGKEWSIVKYNRDANSDGSGIKREISSFEENSEPAVAKPSGEIAPSSGLVEEGTLYKEINGVPYGLSSDDIFKIVSRRYRESDRRGFFHNSPKK